MPIEIEEKKDKYAHKKRERNTEKIAARKKNKKKKGNQQGSGNKGQSQGGGAFSSSGKSNQDQRDGNFSFDTIHGLKLKEVEYTVPPIAQRKAQRAEFNGVYNEDHTALVEPGIRAKFLKHLANDPVQRNLLKERLAFTDEMIDMMAEKGYAPTGFNVHHKVALHGNGGNDLSNFILTPLYPHDQLHQDIMDPQINGIREGETRKILVPWTDDMIYDPKQYGFTRDGNSVQPNYTSNVDRSKYAHNYSVEHVEKLRANPPTTEQVRAMFESKSSAPKQQVSPAAIQKSKGNGR